MNLKSIGCTLSLLLLLGGCSAKQGPVAASYQLESDDVLVDLTSVEYKVLINPELLKDKAGYQGIWDLLIDTASQQGISVKSEEKLKIKHRNIQYLDTGNLELRKHGYTLRYRQKYKDFAGFGDDANKLGEKYDVTLKYRSGDKAKALDSGIAVDSNRFKGKKPELEADITPKGIIYSHAAKVKLKEGKKGSFAKLFDYSVKGAKGYATMYPLLAELDLNGNYIVPVADITVVEAKMEPGFLLFKEGVEPEVAISKFYDAEGQPFVGEVSFDFDIEGDKHTVTFAELKQIEAYYTALLTNLGDKVYEGTTK
ncbi:MAG: hypothetical protein ABFR63_10635, partial [Thermodesulfobacteriota bacterium]